MKRHVRLHDHLKTTEQISIKLGTEGCALNVYKQIFIPVTVTDQWRGFVNTVMNPWVL
jgi:hypothetical protein